MIPPMQDKYQPRPGELPPATPLPPEWMYALNQLAQPQMEQVQPVGGKDMLTAALAGLGGALADDQSGVPEMVQGILARPEQAKMRNEARTAEYQKQRQGIIEKGAEAAGRQDVAAVKAESAQQVAETRGQAMEAVQTLRNEAAAAKTDLDRERLGRQADHLDAQIRLLDAKTETERQIGPLKADLIKARTRTTEMQGELAQARAEKLKPADVDEIRQDTAGFVRDALAALNGARPFRLGKQTVREPEDIMATVVAALKYAYANKPEAEAIIADAQTKLQEAVDRKATTEKK